MRQLVDRALRNLKGEEFALDPAITSGDLAGIAMRRGLMAAHGTAAGIRLRRAGTPFFLGPGVRLRHARLISLGRSVTLERGVEIDALSSRGVTLGDNVRIGAYTLVKCSGTVRHLGVGVRMGPNSGIGEFSYLGAAGGISIGADVIMGQNIRFHSENHDFDRTDIPIREQGTSNRGIVIDDDVWVGAGTVFLDGVHVGRGCVIGANTLVNRDLPPYSVAVGSPVKVTRSRLRESAPPGPDDPAVH